MIGPIEIILAVFELLVGVGIIWLQVLLSKKSSRWPGLLLPTLGLLYSLTIVLGFNGWSEEIVGVEEDLVYVEKVDGDWLHDETVLYVNGIESGCETSLAIFPALLITNTINGPTLIFLVIYIICRRKLKKKFELDRMTIQDLE